MGAGVCARQVFFGASQPPLGSTHSSLLSQSGKTGGGPMMRISASSSAISDHRKGAGPYAF